MSSSLQVSAPQPFSTSPSTPRSPNSLMISAMRLPSALVEQVADHRRLAGAEEAGDDGCRDLAVGLLRCHGSTLHFQRQSGRDEIDFRGFLRDRSGAAGRHDRENPAPCGFPARCRARPRSKRTPAAPAPAAAMRPGAANSAAMSRSSIIRLVTQSVRQSIRTTRPGASIAFRQAARSSGSSCVCQVGPRRSLMFGDPCLHLPVPGPSGRDVVPVETRRGRRVFRRTSICRNERRQEPARVLFSSMSWNDPSLLFAGRYAGR